MTVLCLYGTWTQFITVPIGHDVMILNFRWWNWYENDLYESWKNWANDISNFICIKMYLTDLLTFTLIWNLATGLFCFVEILLRKSSMVTYTCIYFEIVHHTLVFLLSFCIYNPSKTVNKKYIHYGRFPFVAYYEHVCCNGQLLRLLVLVDRLSSLYQKFVMSENVLWPTDSNALTKIWKCIVWETLFHCFTSDFFILQKFEIICNFNGQCLFMCWMFFSVSVNLYCGVCKSCKNTVMRECVVSISLSQQFLTEDTMHVLFVLWLLSLFICYYG